MNWLQKISKSISKEFLNKAGIEICKLLAMICLIVGLRKVISSTEDLLSAIFIALVAIIWQLFAIIAIQSKNSKSTQSSCNCDNK